MEIKDLVLEKPRFNALIKKLRTKKSIFSGGTQYPHTIQLTGLTGSSAAAFLAPLKQVGEGIYLFVLEDEEQAGYFYHDLVQVVGEDRILFFPSGYKRSIKYGQIDSANEILRTEALATVEALINKQSDNDAAKEQQGQQSDNDASKEQKDTQTAENPAEAQGKLGGLLIVTYPEALAEKVAKAEQVQSQMLTLHKGEKVDSKFVVSLLNDFGFQRKDYVYEPGQFAVRGSIIDVFGFTYEYPFRIDFFGNEIDSLRTFEVDTQLSRTVLDEITIAPSFTTQEHNGISFAEFLPDPTVLICRDVTSICERVEDISRLQLAEQLIETEEGDMQALEKLVNAENFTARLTTFRRVLLNDKDLSDKIPSSKAAAFDRIDFHTSPQPEWHKNFDLITDDMKRLAAEGYTLHILSDSPKQLDRIEAIMDDRGETLRLIRIPRAIHRGFIDHDTKYAYFTDHQIFDRFHKYNLKSDRARSGKIALSLKELMEFQIGDYIVHVDHGVGLFGGLINMPINVPDPDNPGKTKQIVQEVVKLTYKDSELYVSIHQLDKLSKYRGKDSNPPVLNSLGNNAWEKMKSKTKEKMKDMARDLILLYAKRRDEQGFAFSPDSNMQHELEASFIYEDTPDQLKATNDVKRDMERARPMDRLICGDVGFGKTEVAIRAALKACSDCKQVAVLVPTTVLALQHYKTFSSRLKEFPVRVDYLSRARSPKEVKKILEDLASGDINILIGTHKLIGKTVKFNDLGLLIIDEEQKFGVRTKEALRAMRTNVDTLTLTATPIPRTLQFSLMGARDMSVIGTPPPNRYPIQTEVHRDDDAIIKEAINFELSRNGQVFVINNRISQLPDIQARIQRLVPDARVAFAHGQMDPEDMERLILDFANYEYDVIVCTTIVEAGLDIPNANTMIVMNAHNFGLSELHQLRGRVGRTNRKAFCYLFCPPFSLLTSDARRRLQAIENFSGLGSGIHLAMQDLDIRGAGNLLGGEQSGFIADLGYETYQKILKQAMRELKHTEFSTLFEQREEVTEMVTEECPLDTDLDLSFGEKYVPDSAERISLYQELDGLETEKQLEDYRDRLKDRFGKIPDQGEELIRVVTLRQLGRRIGFEKIILREGRMKCQFLSDNDDYFQSEHFEHLLDYLSRNARNVKLEEKNGHRYFIALRVRSVKEAIEYLKQCL